MRKDILDNFDAIVSTIADDNLVVMRSETIYGIFASAMSKKAVSNLHNVRERDSKQGFIVLIDSIKTLNKIVSLPNKIVKRLDLIWQAAYATSVVLPAKNIKEKWLPDQRPEFKDTVCFRLPHDKTLQRLIATVGPLCAPSANLPGRPPASNIKEAKQYFPEGGGVGLYVDGGECAETKPSRIIRLRPDGSVETLRPDGFDHPEDLAPI